MAWQLIYSSAPRLLEAGRSGFGTVARHREISPLLVSAIERVSQFSRQPGLDASRIIYSYRIIPLSGGRFHVLSCIRDAGADYTGRTNHLAHHIIVDEREIARAGSEGATPADVLLGMRWVAEWTEPPRHLSAADEIRLESFHRQTGPQNAAWKHAAGSAECAWLLVSGEAARGAYLITPPTVDLRWLFAESMRLAPERAWQLPLTTCLQPSDESSDFRWIGLDEDSSLRSRVEHSGRPVLNLTRPESLPRPEIPVENIALVEKPAPMAAVPAEVSVSSQSTALPVPVAPVSVPISPRVLQPQQPPPRVAAAAQEYGHVPGAAKPKARHAFRILWLSAAAIVLVAALGFGVIRPFLQERKRAAELRIEISRILDRSDYFSDDTKRQLTEGSSPKLTIAREIANIGAESVTVVREAKFLEMDVRRPSQDLRQRANAAGMDGIPRELLSLDDKIERLKKVHVHLTTTLDPESGQTRYEELSAKEVEIAAISSDAPKPEVFKESQRQLKNLVYQQQIAVLTGLLETDAGPALKLNDANSEKRIKWLKTQFSELRPKVQNDSGTVKNIDALDRLVSDWKKIEDMKEKRSLEDPIVLIEKSSASWPNWLKQLAKPLDRLNVLFTNGQPRALTPPAPLETSSMFPVYFVRDRSGLEKLKIPGGDGELEFSLKTSVGGAAVPLVVINGKLRIDVTAEPIFGLERQASTLQFRSAVEGDRLKLPFVISARASKNDVFEVWVLPSSDNPAFGSHRGGITRAGDIFKVDLMQLPFRGRTKGNLQLSLPVECMTPGKSLASLEIIDGTVDSSPFRKEIARRRDELQKEIDSVNGKSVGPAAITAAHDPVGTETDVARFATAKEFIKGAMKREIDRWMTEARSLKTKGLSQNDRGAQMRQLESDKKRMEQKNDGLLSDTNGPLYKQLAGCVMAVTGEPDVAFKAADSMYNVAARLKNATAEGAVQELSNLNGELKKATWALTVPEKRNYGDIIDTLQNMADLSASDLKANKAPIVVAKTISKADQAELAQLNANPLFADKVPTGTYYLSVSEGAEKFKLLEIVIP